jgi:outer membrane biosynthesis protein TonB
MRVLTGRRRAAKSLSAVVCALIALAAYAASTAHAQNQAEPKPVKVSEAEALKYATYRQMSDPLSKALRLHGSVTIEYTISTVGSTKDMVPIAGDTKNALIVSRAEYIINTWRFENPHPNGQMIAMRTTSTIKFGE